MSGITVSEILDDSNPTYVADALRVIKFGGIIRGLVPETIVLTGLSSNASQALVDTDGEPVYGQIEAVTLSDDTPLARVIEGSVGSGEVKVAYDSDCRPTLTFNAAVTGFKVQVRRIGSGFAAALAQEL